MFLWCVRDGWRDIYSERGLLLPKSSSGSQGVATLAPPCFLEAPLLGCVSPFRLRFSALCLNLTAWFSSRGLLPVTYLLYPTALIVLWSSCLLIKMWQLAKTYGVTRNEPKIHVICYITVRPYFWRSGKCGYSCMVISPRSTLTRNGGSLQYNGYFT